MTVFLPLTASPSSTSLFLAIAGWQEGSSLSPKVMAWNEDILLIDLSPTLSYWRQRASEQFVSLEELICQCMPEQARGVLADHPWKAVLHLKTFCENGVGQLLPLSSPLGSSLVKRLSWLTWEESCLTLIEHFITSDVYKPSQRQAFKKDLKALLTTVQKNMQLTSPISLKEVHDLSIRRRFGSILAEVWKWTWSQDPQSVDHFPWRTIVSKVLPQVERVLTYPLREWQFIEPILCEDLDRICNLNCWDSSERVVSLEWALSFSNSPTLIIPVLFRHPHALHREAGHHKTALLQAFHSWSATFQKSLKKSLFKANSQYLGDDSITEWTLKVKELLSIAPSMQSLFEDDANSCASRLRDLENTLPLALESFSLKADWTPEGSWTTEKGEVKSSCADKPSDSFLSLAGLYKQRPLFLRKSPKSLPHEEMSSMQGIFFKERVMTKWWESNHEEPMLKDHSYFDHEYFLRVSDHSQLQWVYRNDHGHLFLHGMYG